MSDKPKLDWDYDQSSGEQRATYKGLVIRAVRDSDASNPFENEDGHWPMLVRTDGRITFYWEDTSPWYADDPLARFTPEQLVHDQKAIAKVLGAEDYDVRYHMPEGNDAWTETEDRPIPKWLTDVDILRDWFDDAWEGVSDSDKLDKCAELYALLGIPHLNTCSRGYSQGDYAELLIVATPEAQKALREQPADMDAETWAKALSDDLTSQKELYGAWAWGDVYGYVIETCVNADEPAACANCANTLNDGSDVCDQCGGDFEAPEPEYEEIPDGSCWGYYGSDHAKSGLEESALEAADCYLAKQENTDAQV